MDEPRRKVDALCAAAFLVDRASGAAFGAATVPQDQYHTSNERERPKDADDEIERDAQTCSEARSAESEPREAHQRQRTTGSAGEAQTQ